MRESKGRSSFSSVAPLEYDATEYHRIFVLLEQLPQGIVLVDPSTYLPVELNAAAHNLLGYTLDEFKLISILDHFEEKKVQDFTIPPYLTGNANMVSFDTRFLTKVGELRDISAHLYKISIDGRKFLHLIFDDFTDRLKTENRHIAEQEIFAICNSADKKVDLVHNLLAFFKTFTGCTAVGIRLREGDDFPYFETDGFPDEFVLLENSLCANDEDGTIFRDHKGDPVLECMCGNIIRGRFDPTKPFFTEHGSFWTGSTTQLLATTSDDERQSRTRNRCNGSGYESVALIPIRHNGITYGLFQFNDKRTGWHTVEKVAVLEYLVDYIAIALAKMEADQTLSEKEQDFKQIYNSITEAVFIQDSETGKIIDVNETMVKMFGFFSKAEAVSKTISDLSYGDQKVNFQKSLELVQKASTEGPQVFEWLCQKTNGKSFWVEVVLNRSLIAGKKRVLAVVRDISERKRMEEALNSSIERYRLLFQEMIEGFALHEIILDERGKPVDYRFLDVNPAFEYLTGLKRETLIGHTVLEVLPGTEEYWIEKYGDIAIHGGEQVYENYASELKKWFKVTAYCPKFGQFATLFEDITNKKLSDISLKESEEQFRSTFEQTSIGMCILSLDGNFLRINLAFCKMIGYQPEELLGNPVSSITHPDDLHITKEKLKESLLEETRFIQFDKRFIHKDGHIVFVSISSTLVRDASGKPRQFVTQVQDITGKKETEEALHLRDKIFTHSVDMLFIAGFDGFLKVLNPAWEATLGWSEEYLLSKPWIEFVHPEDKVKTEEVKVGQLNYGTEVIQFENRYLCKDGSYRWLSWNSFPYPEENIIVGVARDVTDKKAMDESLRQSEERYHLIDEASSDQIYSYDRQGRFTHVNTALCKTLGLSSDLVVGKNHRELGFPEEQCAEWDKLHEQVYLTNNTVIAETIATINNETQYFEVALDPIHDSDGNIVGIAGTTRDIDARKKAEKKIQEQMDELRRWNTVTLGRENRIIELKKEVNELLKQVNLPPRYSEDPGMGERE